MFEDIYRRTDDYYSARLATYGANASGVDWNSVESQEQRFAQLIKIFNSGGET